MDDETDSEIKVPTDLSRSQNSETSTSNHELENVQKAELKHLFDISEKRMSSEHFYRVFLLTGPTQKSHFYCPFQS